MKWKLGEMLANDIWTWKNFTNEESIISCEIWTLMSEITGEQYPFDELFQVAHHNLELKLKMIDDVVTCLNAYCQKATDKNRYETIIDQCTFTAFWQKALELIANFEYYGKWVRGHSRAFGSKRE